jgi:hypothetical protein
MDAGVKEKLISSIVDQNFLEEQKKITSSIEWIDFSKTHNNLYKIILKKGFLFNPKFNSVLWAFDVARLCNEIAFSYCWMNSYAKIYKKRITPGSQPAHVDFHVSYFADNCITRIDSCRDKLALMVWAYYCSFNPENRDEVLDYEKVIERVKYPVKFGLKLKKQDDFLYYLENLSGADFSRVGKYRHFKIHRREPRIEIYGPEQHHDWPYMLPLIDKRDIARWKEELKEQYPEPGHRERVEKGRYIDGVLFDRRKIRDRLWGYEEVEKHIKSCLVKLLKASDGCFRILRRRLPFSSAKGVLNKKLEKGGASIKL